MKISVKYGFCCLAMEASHILIWHNVPTYGFPMIIGFWFSQMGWWLKIWFFFKKIHNMIYDISKFKTLNTLYSHVDYWNDCKSREQHDVQVWVQYFIFMLINWLL